MARLPFYMRARFSRWPEPHATLWVPWWGWPFVFARVLWRRLRSR